MAMAGRPVEALMTQVYASADEPACETLKTGAASFLGGDANVTGDLLVQPAFACSFCVLPLLHAVRF